MDIGGSVVVAKCLSVACGGSVPFAFRDIDDVLKDDENNRIMAVCRVIRGQGTVSTDAAGYPLAAGTMLIMDGAHTYRFTATDNLTVNIVAFDSRLFGNSYAYMLGQEALTPIRAVAEKSGVLTKDDTCYTDILATTDEIWLLAEINDPAAALMAVSLLWKLAAQLKQDLARKGEAGGSARQSRNRIRLAPVIQFIYKEYKQRISLADLAREASMSIPNFSTVFRETFGMPPMEYLNGFRLQIAADLLVNTDMKIIDIAEESGFFSNSNFIKAFHNGMGMSPSQYRSQYDRMDGK